MRTIEQVEAWAAAHPHQAGGAGWAGWCEAFVHTAGGFTEIFPTGTAAGDASGHLDPDPSTALPGEIHYFGGGPGHDCFQTAHGLLMASMSVSSIAPGLGYLPTVADYVAAWPSHPYRGHTHRHGTETLQPSASSASTSTPILITPKIGEDMVQIINVTDGTTQEIWVIDDGPRTKWNIAVGRANWDDIVAYKNWLIARGMHEVDGIQPIGFLSAYRDITNDPPAVTVSDAQVKQIAAAIHIPSTLTGTLS